MKLKPYRFSLPAIGMPLAALLIMLENSLHTSGLLLALSEVINFPAFLVYRELAAFEGRHFFGIHSAYNISLFVVLAGLWWYFVGLELDFNLLRRTAKETLVLRIGWLVVAAGSQVFVIYLLVMTVISLLRRPPTLGPMPIYGYLMVAVFELMLLACIEALALRFWRASNPSTLFRKRHSL